MCIFDEELRGLAAVCTLVPGCTYSSCMYSLPYFVSLPANPGNYEEQGEMCIFDEELRALVLEAESAGWSFVNEGTAEKKKQG